MTTAEFETTFLEEAEDKPRVASTINTVTLPTSPTAACAGLTVDAPMLDAAASAATAILPTFDGLEDVMKMDDGELLSLYNTRPEYFTGIGTVTDLTFGITSPTTAAVSRQAETMVSVPDTATATSAPTPHIEAVETRAGASAAVGAQAEDEARVVLEKARAQLAKLVPSAADIEAQKAAKAAKKELQKARRRASNRAAAVRYRRSKSAYITQLEAKVVELQAKNERFASRLAALGVDPASV